jgi:threonine-phosphate decarboxylase
MSYNHNVLEGLHVHGGSPCRDMKRLGIDVEHVRDFSVSISPFGPPEEIRAAWSQLIEEIADYPDVEGQGLVDFLSKKYGIDPDRVIAGNGSTELIYLVPRALRLKRAVVPVPSFSDYHRALNIAGTEIIPLVLSDTHGFSPPDYEKIAQVLKDAEALVIGNPNNPTGTIYPRDMIVRLAQEYPEKWLIIDEAFVQFLDNREDVSLMSFTHRPHIIVLYSLTKFYALPGLRMGCAVAHRDVIAHLRRFKEPWTVNAIADKTAQILLQCRDYEEQLRRFTKKERIRVFDKLKNLKGLRAFESRTNFFLSQWTKTNNLDDLLICLLKQGIYVRDCRNFPGLEKNFFRFALCSEQDNNHLIHALSECLS